MLPPPTMLHPPDTKTHRIIVMSADYLQLNNTVFPHSLLQNGPTAASFQCHSTVGCFCAAKLLS